ncbi:MAG: hypothetical protein ACQPRJ_02555 [Solitalea-like symbiont of Acarus siro]
MKTVIINVIKFVLLIIIQFFFLKNLSIYGVYIPFLYILFIILLPISTPYIVVYLSSFLLGLTIDLFLNTPGINAATCVISAFVRIILLNFIEHEDKSDKNISIAYSKKNLKGFFVYIVALSIIHGFTLSILEAANFRNFLITIKTSIYNILLTVSIINVILYLLGINKLKSGK